MATTQAQSARQNLEEEASNISTSNLSISGGYSSAFAISANVDNYIYANATAPVGVWGSGALGVLDPFLRTPEKRSKKRKVPNLKKNVSEKEIAIAISKHSEKQDEKFLDFSRTVMAQAVQGEEQIKLLTRQLAKQKNLSQFCAKQLAKKIQTSKPKLQQQFLREIEKIKKLEQVKDITIDTDGRIIITTIPLTVKKDNWEEERTIGQFQIQIDFSQGSFDRGVRVLNITQRYGCYDSPTIQNACCCWGNIGKDINREFMSQSLLELVEDMIDYCSSPNVQHGFLGRGDGGDASSGWDIWFSDLTKWPKNYNWEKYEKDQESNTGFNNYLGQVIGPPPTLRTTTDTPTRPVSPEGYLAQPSLGEREPFVMRNPYEQSLFEAIVEIGIIGDSRERVFRAFRRYTDIISLRIQRNEENINDNSEYFYGITAYNSGGEVDFTTLSSRGEINDVVLASLIENNDIVQRLREAHEGRPGLHATVSSGEGTSLNETTINTLMDHYTEGIEARAREDPAMRRVIDEATEEAMRRAEEESVRRVFDPQNVVSENNILRTTEIGVSTRRLVTE